MLNATDAYPPTVPIKGSPFKVDPETAVNACGAKCFTTEGCGFFWVYTAGKSGGDCFLKASVLPGPLMKPVCASCKGLFYQMVADPSPPPAPAPPSPPRNGSQFGEWSDPSIVEKGQPAHQLYSQITWRFYDIFLGIVMKLVVENGTV